MDREEMKEELEEVIAMFDGMVDPLIGMIAGIYTKLGNNTETLDAIASFYKRLHQALLRQGFDHETANRIVANWSTPGSK